ncbi:MAG: OmpA family protein [Ignavibacteriae bacterium]|nr:OmpA family protein [Ignavibacteriota bacterium]
MNTTLLNRYYIFLSITFMLILFGNSVHGQDSNFVMPSNLGIYGGLNFNMHTPSFIFHINNRNITFNQNNSNLWFHLGFIGNYPLNETFTVSGRIGYNGLSGNLSENVTYLDTFSTNTITADLHYIEISPVMQFHNLLPVKRLYFLAGLEFGIPISTKYTFKQNQLTPIINQSLKNGDIPDATLRFAGAIGAGYIFNINDNSFLIPEISYRIPFNHISGNRDFTTWDVPQLRVGVALTFGLEKSKVKPPEVYSNLEIGFREVNYYDKERQKHTLQNIRVEDVQYTELFPMVPYIFCDENQPAPSDSTQILTGKSEKGEFKIDMVEPDAMKINVKTLDIIGKRMTGNPDADLIITGTIDNKKEKPESQLPLRRAEFAKEYLVNIYKINPDKINVKTGGLPEKPSAQTVPEGDAENRRIELSSSNPKILAPIILKGESQTIAEPNLVEFVPFINSSDSVTSWQFEIEQAGQTIRNVKGSGDIHPIQFVIIPNELKKSQIPIDYVLTATNTKDLKRTVSGSIPTEYFSFTRKKSEELPDKTISKYSLILFDFDKAEISDKDKAIIEENILPEIKFNSTVKIYGYTDKIGKEDYNKSLSERRAAAVKDLLSSKVKDAKFETYGVGENEVIFDNNSPIGRQLSRTVQIYVITPRQ